MRFVLIAPEKKRSRKRRGKEKREEKKKKKKRREQRTGEEVIKMIPECLVLVKRCSVSLRLIYLEI